jgi:hypothetical protein
MKGKISLLKVSFCGPGDVTKEIEIAKTAVIAWNAANMGKTGYALEVQHWPTNSAPDASVRTQQAINQQMLDHSDLVIAIFWRRLGTPTGLAESGTVEEVQRSVARGVRVMIYFSDLEAPSHATDDHQYARLQDFRARVMANASGSTFSSRRKFESMVANHIDLAVADLIAARTASKKAAKKAPPKRTPAGQTNISQGGRNNTQVVGDGNTIHAAPVPAPKIIIGPLPGQITPKEQRQVTKWVHALADLSLKVKKGKDEAGWRREYWSRLLNKFDVPRYNALMSDQVPDVRKWYQTLEATLLGTKKAKSSGAVASKWKTSIKTKMKAMGRTNEDYYPEIARRLGIAAFSSLTEPSNEDLGRVYRKVLEDERKR